MSDTTYMPHTWVVIRIEDGKGESVRKVLATFYGRGPFDSSYWKLNSGIESEVHGEDHIDYHGYSGSVYKCTKDSHGLSGLTDSVLRNLTHNVESVGGSVYLETFEESTRGEK